MSLFFQTKYEKKRNREAAREERIKNLMELQKITREQAVNTVAYSDQLLSHYSWKFLAGVVFGVVGRRSLLNFTAAYPLLNKSWIYYPILLASFGTGAYLYDKLKGHYFNWFDADILHHWHIDYQSKYLLKNNHNKNWQENLDLTEFDRMKRQWEERLNSVDIDGAKVLRRISKDKNDFYYLFSKVRNLENIVFLKPEEIENVKSPIELQIKLDSIDPTLIRSDTLEESVKSLHEIVRNYKAMVENSNNFRSIKDKLLGLPSMMLRMQQYPEPNPGTWQYEMFEQIFGFEYDLMKNVPESQEKINKYNYANFLHPSIIKKFDVNSEEFDLYIKKLNYLSETTKEFCESRRGIYCKKYLPKINLCKDRKTAESIVHMIRNKNINSTDYENYLYFNYSNNIEQFAFRQMEEARFLDKNKPNVNRFFYSNVDKSKVGMRASEFNEIMNNPTKFKKVRKAIETKFKHYEPISYMDKLRFHARKAGFLDTLIENDVDVRDPEFDIMNVFLLQYGTRNPTEEEEVAKAHYQNFPQWGFNNNTYPYNQDEALNYFNYNGFLDWSDYCSEFPGEGLVSPKKDRLELYNKSLQNVYDQFFFRFYNNPKYDNFTGYVYPYKDYNNEEMAERIPKRHNFLKYADRQKVTDSEMDTLRFLEDTTEKESFAPSDDLTEEELDQAIYEASYMKPIHETEEYKKIDKTFDLELENLFKVFKFQPHEYWNDDNGLKKWPHLQFTDKAQYKDPLYLINSEVEHPTVIRHYLRDWRSGAEVRFKLPYYPEEKTPTKYFNYI